MTTADRRVKLLFLLPGMVMGGAERHGLDLMRRLRRAGYDTSLVIYGRNSTGVMEAIVRAEGAVLLGIKGMSRLAGWVRVCRELRRQDADVIFCVNHSVAVVATVLQRLGLIRGKNICIFHTTVLQPNDQKNFPLFQWVARGLDVLVYVSATQQQYWRSRGLRALRDLRIANGIDLDQFGEPPAPAKVTRASLGLDAQDYVIGIVAGLRPEKNHEELIEALAILRNEGLPAKVLIVGEGARRAAIKARTGELGLGDHVIFAGEQADVRPYVRLCDVCVLCSTTESFSLAAMEALALGVPFVSSQVGGMAEIVQPEVNGLLYPSGDPAALAERLARLSRPEAREPMRAAARASLLAYGVDRMVDQYVELVSSLTPPLSGRSPTRKASPALSEPGAS